MGDHACIYRFICGRITSYNVCYTKLLRIESEAIAALLALGYKPQQASMVVSKVMKPEMTVESVIREALKSML